jgi:hypothetical protein
MTTVAKSFARAKQFEGLRGNLAQVAARSPGCPFCRVALDLVFVEVHESTAMDGVEPGAFEASHRRFADAKALGDASARQRVATRSGNCRAGCREMSSRAGFAGHPTMMVLQLRMATAGWQCRVDVGCREMHEWRTIAEPSHASSRVTLPRFSFCRERRSSVIA